VSARPLPQLTGLAGEFYGFCKVRELRFQRCVDCSAWRHVPRERCGECGSADFRWERSSGRGRVYTWTVANRSMHPAFPSDASVAPVVVEMEEGVRLVSALENCPPGELAIGMPVEVVYEDVTETVTLPKFRRRA
jgi:uncharacterized OB-fold protein